MNKALRILITGCPFSPLHPRLARLGALRGFARPVQAVPESRQTPLIGLVNESEDVDRVAMIGLSNEITATAGDGWALIPYGEWPNERGLQRFGRAEADQMVGFFKNTWNRIKRAFVGMPILRGHSDFQDTLKRERDRAKTPADRARLDSMFNEAAAKWPDRTVYGTISDMEARDDGLAIRPVLTEAGAALVNESGLKFFSPHWLAMDLPPKDGKPVKAPVFMVSIGLTDRPNITGTSLVNETRNQNTTMPQWLLILLGLVNEAPENHEAKAKAKLTELLARPEPTALVNEQTARTTAETQLVEVKGKLTTAETALVNERAAFKTVVTERNTALVNAAVQLGRITEASKPTWLARLEREFATESTALANEKEALKTRSRTENLGERKPASEAGSQFTALVNEALPKHGNDWTAAWAAVKATKEGKALHEKMEAASTTAAT